MQESAGRNRRQEDPDTGDRSIVTSANFYHERVERRRTPCQQRWVAPLQPRGDAKAMALPKTNSQQSDIVDRQSNDADGGWGGSGGEEGKGGGKDLSEALSAKGNIGFVYPQTHFPRVSYVGRPYSAPWHIYFGRASPLGRHAGRPSCYACRGSSHGRSPAVRWSRDERGSCSTSQGFIGELTAILVDFLGLPTRATSSSLPARLLGCCRRLVPCSCIVSVMMPRASVADFRNDGIGLSGLRGDWRRPVACSSTSPARSQCSSVAGAGTGAIGSPPVARAARQDLDGFGRGHAPEGRSMRKAMDSGKGVHH